MKLPASPLLRLCLSLAALLLLYPVTTCAQQKSAAAERNVSIAFRHRIERLQKALDKLEAGGNGPKASELRHRLNAMLSDAEDRLFTASRRAAEIQTEYDQLTSKCKTRLERLKRLLANDQLDTQHGVHSSIDSFNDRLADLEESWKDGTTYLSASNVPIVQWIHARDPAWAKSANQIASGGLPNATLQLGKLRRPSILALSSDVAVHWKLTGDAANVKAIVLYNEASRFESDEQKLVFRPKSRGGQMEENIATQVGHAPDLKFTFHRFDRPIELDPRRKDWTHAYVLGQLSHLSRDIQAQVNNAFAATQPDLRFPGFTVETRSFNRFSSLAEFNLKGPADYDRRPMTMKSRRKTPGINMWNYTDVGADAYSLIDHGQFAKRGTSDADWQIVSSPPGTSRQQFRSIAHDTKRNRLVVLDAVGTLYAFDLANSKWTVLRKDAKALFGLAYQPESDLIVAIRQTPNAHKQQDKDTWLVYLDDQGQVSREIKSTYSDSIQNPVERTYNEFALTDKYLIATQPPATSRRNPLRSVIRVFDLKTAEVHYDYMLPVTSLTESNIAPGEENTYAIYQRKYRAAHVAIEKARQFDREAAKAFAGRLQEFSDPIVHAQRPRTEPVIYWVRTFRDRAPLVKVSDKSGPIILAVSSFDLTEWRFQLEAGVNVQEVIFVGLNPPKYKGLPEDIKVTNSTESLQGNERQPAYQKSVIEKLVAQSYSTTQPKFAAELDLSSSDHLPFTVLGSANASETIGRVNAELSELTLEAGKISGDSKVSEDFRFAYLYQGDGEDRDTTFLAECDFRGPIMQTQRRLPKVRPQQTLNSIALAGPGLFYGVMNRDGVSELRVTDTHVDVSPTPIDPNGNLNHLMFDPGTRRLFGGSSDRLALPNEKQRGKWSDISIEPLPTRNSHRTAWCYDSTNKRFFAIVRTHFDITEIHEVLEGGKLRRKLKLPVPIPAELHPQSDLFSAFCDSKNIIIVMRSASGKGLAGTNVHVLDIESLETVHQGDFRPHVVYESVSPERFQTLWEQLAVADEFHAEAIKWQLVAGGQEVAERLKRITGDLGGLSRADVVLAVKQLDADTYAERQAASEKLFLGARHHVDYVRGLKKEDHTAEQWYRIQKLLNEWSGGSRRAELAFEIVKEIEDR